MRTPSPLIGYLVLLALGAACGRGKSDRTSSPGAHPNEPTAHYGPSCFNIVNGAETTLDGAVGLIAVTDGGSVTATCSGTFIGENMLLTAAHCALNSPTAALYWIPGASLALPQTPAATATFLAGGKKAAQVLVDSADLQPTPAKAATAAAQAAYRDEAVLIFNESVAPATLALATTALNDGDDVTLIGYGDTALPLAGAQTTTGDGTLQKREGLNNAIVNDQIQKAYGQVVLVGGDPDLVQGAYAQKLSLAAPGDSGGPLVHNNTIVGILSQGARDDNGTLGELIHGRAAFNIYADARNAAMTTLLARAKVAAAAALGTGTGSGAGSAGTGSSGTACLTDEDD